MSKPTHGFAPKNAKARTANGYQIWGSMIHRCHSPKSSGYYLYGGRGITVCDRWRNSFPAFLEDMGPKPKGKSLDRIDNNKGYSKENCRWATQKEQSANRRDNRIFTIDGESKCLAEWCRRYGKRFDTVWRRIYQRGMNPSDALRMPIGSLR